MAAFNFAHGYPCFAVSLGLEEAGEPIVGVIFQPVSGELFTAAKGEGAYLNQKKIHVSRIETLATSLLCTGFPSVKRSQNPEYPLLPGIFTSALAWRAARRLGRHGPCCRGIKCGRFEAFWEFGLHTWDRCRGHSAGARGGRHGDALRRPALQAGRQGAARVQRPSSLRNEGSRGQYSGACCIQDAASITESLYFAFLRDHRRGRFPFCTRACKWLH